MTLHFLNEGANDAESTQKIDHYVARPPLENLKGIGFLSNTGPERLENNKATKPAFKGGPSSACQQNTI